MYLNVLAIKNVIRFCSFLNMKKQFPRVFTFCFFRISLVVYYQKTVSKNRGAGKKDKEGWSYRGLSIEGGQIFCTLIGVNNLGANVNTIKNYH